MPAISEIVNFRVPPQLRSLIRDQADLEGVTMSEILRKAVDRYLTERSNLNQRTRKEISNGSTK